MREPKPFARTRKHVTTWYVHLDGQINLGTDEKAANEEYHRLMAQRGTVPAGTMTVSDLMTRFLAWTQKHRAKATFEWYSEHLRPGGIRRPDQKRRIKPKAFPSFEHHVGQRMKASQVRPGHVEEWLAVRYVDAGPTFKNGGVRALSRAFNWARKQGYIDRNPITDVERPAYQPREIYYDAEQWQQILAAIKSPEFLDLVTFMRKTGCRPQEARAVEARHFQRSSKCIEFERAESKGKKHRRVVPLGKSALQIVQRLALKSPTGPIFRNPKGEPWTKAAVNHLTGQISKQVGFAFCLYGVRHTFATDALESGVDPITLATLMGHKDVSMLMKVYQHLKLRGKHLRDALDKINGEEDAA